MALDPLACALFVLTAFTIAGAAQTAWFASPWSRRLLVPLDGGRSLGGRRIFGDHKTLRGFVVMVPATAAAFACLAAWLRTQGLEQIGLWPLSPAHYAAVGAWAGLGFMAGELPNSFVKRRLGIVEGGAAVPALPRLLQFLADRLDSGVGLLAALALNVPVPGLTWAYVLGAGLLIHWSFSVWMFRLGIKTRAA